MQATLLIWELDCLDSYIFLTTCRIRRPGLPNLAFQLSTLIDQCFAKQLSYSSPVRSVHLWIFQQIIMLTWTHDVYIVNQQGASISQHLIIPSNDISINRVQTVRVEVNVIKAYTSKKRSKRRESGKWKRNSN